MHQQFQKSPCVDLKLLVLPSPPGACWCRMMGGDQLSFTDAIGGARPIMIPPPVYKRQPSNFARRLAEIPVPAAVAVNAAARPDPAAPMPPITQPDDRACGAASRRLPAAAAARG